MRGRAGAFILGAAVVLLSATLAGAAEPLHVRANAAFAACLEPSIAAWNRAGHAVALDVGDRKSVV